MLLSSILTLSNVGTRVTYDAYEINAFLISYYLVPMHRICVLMLTPRARHFDTFALGYAAFKAISYMCFPLTPPIVAKDKGNMGKDSK